MRIGAPSWEAPVPLDVEQSSGWGIPQQCYHITTGAGNEACSLRKGGTSLRWWCVEHV